MFRSARNTLFASVVAGTMFLAACGSDDNNGPSNPTPSALPRVGSCTPS